MYTLVPAVVSLALHGLLIFLLIVGIPGSARELNIKPAPRVIQAKLMLDAKPVRQPAEKPKPAPKPQPKPKAEPKPEPKPVAKPAPKPLAKPKPAAKTVPDKKAPPKPSAEEIRRKEAAEKAAKAAAEKARIEALEQEIRQQQEDDLAAALASEDEAMETAEAVSSYKDLIAVLVQRNWSRPPTARNGMVAVVAIETIPTGQITNQYIVEGSGDPAFDLSVIRAVTKLGHIEELKQLATENPTAYENNFRRFKFKFVPQDLRR